MKKLTNFLFELGMLRRIKHEGWRIAGIENPESVADHSLRAAQVGYILAKLENYPNPHEIVSILVFHDIGECRIGDIHKVGNRYIKADEDQAVKDQTANLGKIGEEIYKLWHIMENKNPQAGIIAKDADYIEQALTAKEYLEKGYNKASDWITNISNAIQTDSAKELLKTLKEADSNDWWQGLKKLKQET